MVSPALYETAMKSLDEETKRGIELQGKINELEQEIKNYEEKLEENNKFVENTNIKFNTANINISKMSDDIKAKDKENETLQRLLKVKTKEILALERVVNRQNSIQVTKQNELDMIVNTKSNQLSNSIQFDPFTKAKVRIGVQSGLQNQINRAFLTC